MMIPISTCSDPGQNVCQAGQAAHRRIPNGWQTLLATVLLVLLLVSLVPLYGAARYSYPGPDDYRYGLDTHRVWAETGSVGAVLGQAAAVTGETYRSWQGSFAAIFLMALQPGVFSESAYGVSTVLLLTSLCASVLLFCHTCLTRLFKMCAFTALGISALAAFCCVQFLPSPVESYYWFNGGVYYTFFFSLALCFFALLIRRAFVARAADGVLLSVLALLIGGGNLVTGLLCCALLTCRVLWMLIKKRFDPVTLTAWALLTAAFAVNALSPGNGVRQAEHAAEAAAGPVSAILAALSDGAHYTALWLQSPAPWMCLWAVPLVWESAGDAPFRFRCPLLVVAASFLVLSAGFTPNEYALGFAGEARILDIQFFLFVLLWLGNVVYATGWLRQRVKPSARTSRVLCLATVCASLALAGLFALKTRDVAAVSAVRIQKNGTAAAYAQVWEARLSLLREEAQGTVVLPRFESKPPLLCMMDAVSQADDENYWYNEQLEAYFGKESVLLAPDPAA